MSFVPKGTILIALTAIALATTLIPSVFIGTAPLPIADILHTLSGDLIDGDVAVLTTRQSATLFNVRLPHIVMAILVGAALATAGAVYQAVFCNPLADPHLLGISSGASLAATVATPFGVAAAAVPLVGFLGGVLVVTVTYVVGTSFSDCSSPATVILTGIAVAAFTNAMQQFLLRYNEDSLRQIYSWMFGQLGTATWKSILTATLLIALDVCVIAASLRSLDMLSIGDSEATSLGLGVELVRVAMVYATAPITAAAMSASGLVGFVRVIVPRTLRLLAGPGRRLLLPLAVLVGTAFLQLADIAGQTVLTPAEVPIDVVTATAGGPFFLSPLRRYGRPRGRSWHFC